MNILKKVWSCLVIYLIGAVVVWGPTILFIAFAADVTPSTPPAKRIMLENIIIAWSICYGPIIAAVWPIWSLLLRRFGIPTPGDAARFLLLVFGPEDKFFFHVVSTLPTGATSDNSTSQ